MTAGDRIEREIEESSDARPTVAASRCSPDRTVFTEEGKHGRVDRDRSTVELER